MLIPTFLVIICLTWKIHFPSGFTDASFCLHLHKGEGSTKQGNACPGIEQAVGLELRQPTLQCPLLLTVCLAGNLGDPSWYQQGGDTGIFSSARLSCPTPHWPLSPARWPRSVDNCANRSPLFSLGDPIRRVDSVAFWKELVIVLQPAYFTVMGLLQRRAASITESHYVLGYSPLPPSHSSFILSTTRPTAFIFIMTLCWNDNWASDEYELSLYQTCLSSLPAASVGLGASLKEQLSLWM